MNIAIIGASGLVGRKILDILSTSTNDKVICYCSNKSKGKIINSHTMQELTNDNIQNINIDVAIFSAGSNVSKQWANIFTSKGAFVIDNSNAFRREINVPLVVPEINQQTISKSTKIISNPNCSTVQTALPLYYLHQKFKLKKVLATTYQSASGAGQQGLDDLENNTTTKFTHPLKNNLIPQIDIPLDNGYTLEEDKMMFELKKILNLPNLEVCATCVRVPTKFCHGVCVYAEFENQVNIAQVKNILGNAKGIILKDDLKNFIYPLLSDAVNTDYVYVGRIRNDPNNKNALLFWCVADNVRKGAATNAIQILNILKEKFYD